MPNDTFGINDNLKNMHKEFSFFLLRVIAIGSGNKHVFPRLYPPITRQRKTGEFLGFFPKERMGIIRYLSTVSDRFMKVTFSN